MDGRTFKNRLFHELAGIGRALANPHRLELLDVLAQGSRHVDDLAREIQQSVASTSSHLQVLRRARLVEAEKQGLYVYYRLAGEDIFSLWRLLRDVGGERLAEIDRLVDAYFTGRDELHAIDMDELLRLMETDAVVVLDVRPMVEYRQGHIAQAVSIPLHELAARLAELPRDREIVAYCRGPYCVLSDEALRLLQHHGYAVRRLTEGYPEWRVAGYPVSVLAG